MLRELSGKVIHVVWFVVWNENMHKGLEYMKEKSGISIICPLNDGNPLSQFLLHIYCSISIYKC